MLKKASIPVLLSLFAIFLLLKTSATLPQTHPTRTISPDQIFPGVSYEPVNPDYFDIEILADHLNSPTRVKLLPEANYLLISQLSGSVVAFKRTGDHKWVKQIEPVVTIETRFPGFPPDEAGLTGITPSYYFIQNRSLFLFYAYKDKNGAVKNRISRSRLAEIQGKLTGSPPTLIFTANADGSPAHQIQEGESVLVGNIPHLLFPVGDGFKSQNALDPNLEAGKLLLIREDGSNPSGARPFPNPKIQALGIRNSFVMAVNPFDPQKSILLTDTGPEKYDRFIYTSLFFPGNLPLPKINLGWDGTDASLISNVTVDNQRPVPDPVILSLPETRTITGLSFHAGGTLGIPKSDSKSQSVLATVFGKTGVPDPSPGKEIWLGKLSLSQPQPTLTFTPLVKRVKQAAGKLGNPVGLEVDPKTGDFFFLDILEGRLYLVKPK